MSNAGMNQIAERLKAMDARVLYAIMVLVVVAVLALDIFLIAKPQFEGINSLGKNIAMLKTEIDTLATNKQRIASLRQQIDEKLIRRDAFNALVYPKAEVPAVLKKILSLAAQSGVKIDQIMPNEGKQEVLVQNEDGKYYGLTVFIQAQGGFHEFGKFLLKLEQQNVFWALDRLTFTSDSKNSKWYMVTISMKVITQEK